MKLKTKKDKLKTKTETQTGGAKAAELGKLEDRNIEQRTPNAEHRVAEAEAVGGLPGVVMKKVRADAKWNGLSAAQRDTLEGWLFEDQLSFEIALERAQKELGFKGSVSSLRRFYEHAAQERMLRSLVSSPEQVQAINGTKVSTEELRAAGMKVMARLFLTQVVQSPGEVKQWSRVARLLLQSQASEQRFMLQREAHELKRKALAFAREQFQYEVMEEALKALPELQRLEEANLSEYERNKRQNALRRRMWGPRIPEPLPESAEEAAEMAKQAILDEAERAEYHVWWHQTFGSPEAKARIAAESAAEREEQRQAELRLEEEARREAEVAQEQAATAQQTPEPAQEPEPPVKFEVPHPNEAIRVLRAQYEEHQAEQAASRERRALEQAAAREEESQRSPAEVVVQGVVYPYGQ